MAYNLPIYIAYSPIGLSGPASIHHRRQRFSTIAQHIPDAYWPLAPKPGHLVLRSTAVTRIARRFHGQPDQYQWVAPQPYSCLRDNNKGASRRRLPQYLHERCQAESTAAAPPVWNQTGKSTSTPSSLQAYYSAPDRSGRQNDSKGWYCSVKFGDCDRLSYQTTAFGRRRMAYSQRGNDFTNKTKNGKRCDTTRISSASLCRGRYALSITFLSHGWCCCAPGYVAFAFPSGRTILLTLTPHIIVEHGARGFHVGIASAAPLPSPNRIAICKIEVFRQMREARCGHPSAEKCDEIR